MTHPRKVVVIEDDEWLAEHMARSLEAQGFESHVAHHGLEAISLIDRVQPAAIVLDVLLPGSTGFALLHELQSHADLAGIPVVLCTNTAPELTLEQLRPYGVRRLIDKSTMRPEDIAASVRGALL